MKNSKKKTCMHCGADVTGKPHTILRDGYLPEGLFEEDRVGRGAVLCDDCSLERNRLHAELDRKFIYLSTPIDEIFKKEDHNVHQQETV